MEKIPLNQYERDPSFIKGTLIPWIICLLAAIFYAYDFFLRVMPSVMIHPLMKTYGVGATEIGLISAFYYYAYTPLQIPTGIIVDRYSIRWTLTLSVTLCAVGSLIFASFVNLPAAYAGRILMGIGSAFAFIGALKLASLWLPQKQFALFSGVATGLGTIGAVSADTILSRMVTSLGWRYSVYITAIIGFILAILMLLIIRDKPRWVKSVPTNYSSWSFAMKRLWEISKNWHFWMNGIVGCFLFLPVSVFASLWGVAFLTQSYHLSPADGATGASLIFIGTAIGSPITGWISDAIKSRRLPLLVGVIATLVLSVILIYTPNLSKPILFILLFFMGLFVAPQVLVFAIAREISPPRTTGVATASTNFLVTIGAAIFQPFIGFLLDLQWKGTLSIAGVHVYSTQNYRYALLVLPAVLVIALILTFAIPVTHCRNIFKEPINFQGDQTEGPSN